MTVQLYKVGDDAKKPLAHVYKTDTYLAKLKSPEDFLECLDAAASKIPRVAHTRVDRAHHTVSIRVAIKSPTLFAKEPSLFQNPFGLYSVGQGNAFSVKFKLRVYQTKSEDFPLAFEIHRLSGNDFTACRNVRDTLLGVLESVGVSCERLSELQEASLPKEVLLASPSIAPGITSRL